MKKTMSAADLPEGRRREREQRDTRAATLAAAKTQGKAKGFDKMTQAEKNNLLRALLVEHGYIEAG